MPTATAKQLVTVLALVALLLPIGCSRLASRDNQPGASNTPTTPASIEDGLARTKRTGVLRWGGDPDGGAPFIYNDPDNPERIIGFEIDLMNAIATHLGVRHEMVVVQWDALLDDMLAGRSDMVMNGYEINDERKQRVIFSKPYYQYEQQLVVRAADKDKYRTLDDLKGKRLSTLKGAEANNVLMAAGWKESELLQLDDSKTPYDELELGRVEACLQESIIAAFYANRPGLHMVEQTFAPGVYGVAFRPSDTALRDEIDRVLTKMMDSGELAAIYKKWRIWTDAQTKLGIKQ